MERGDIKDKVKTLAEIMPKEFTNGGYKNTKAYKMRNQIVIKEHSQFIEQDEYNEWPGTHKNIHLWAELDSGYAVGWNENPNRGWSFPVIKM